MEFAHYKCYIIIVIIKRVTDILEASACLLIQLTFDKWVESVVKTCTGCLIAIPECKRGNTFRYRHFQMKSERQLA